MKIAILNDTHCGVRNSSEIFMNYQEEFYRDVFFPYLEEHNIKKVLHLGDYYENRTSINFKALNHNRHIFLDVLRDRGIHMDIIPGNHDVYYKNTNSLNALKELLGHYMNEINIIEECTIMDYDGLRCALIPWINNENESAVLDFLQTCRADILGAHLELQGFEMQAGVVAPVGMDKNIFSRFDMVLSGHYHTKSQQENVHYLGCQIEFFWSDCADRKYFHVLDTETRELTAVENPRTIFKKIFYDDSNRNYATENISNLENHFVKLIVVNKSKPKEFDKFVDRINMKKIYGLQIAENFQDFAGAQVEDSNVNIESTDTLLKTYIDAVDTNLNKEKIKSMVSELMAEAQTLEVA